MLLRFTPFALLLIGSAAGAIVEDVFDSYRDPDTGSVHQVKRFTLQNAGGMKVQVLNYGAIIASIHVPNQNGDLLDVALGWGNMSGYLSEYGRNPYFGATIGRVSNRIANAKFELDGVEYQLAKNNGENHLHGGERGFDKRMWTATPDETTNSVRFLYTSQDGQEGYPGTVSATIKFTLTTDNELWLEYEATTNKPTPVALTNHNYFNLNGHALDAAAEKLSGHFVELNAGQYTPVRSDLIPTGEIKDVVGSVYDLRTRQNLHSLLQSFPSGEASDGYDVNFCINRTNPDGKFQLGLSFVGRVESETSGISLETYSDQPGVQFYTGNLLPDPTNGELPLAAKNNANYFKHGGFCLETQNYPNAVNQPNFPNPILRPGQTYKHKTVYKFTTKGVGSSANNLRPSNLFNPPNLSSFHALLGLHFSLPFLLSVAQFF